MARKLTKKKQEFFRNLLNDKLRELLKEAAETVTDMSDVKESVPDITDLASLETDRNFLLRIRDRERQLIMKIREAIERVDDETFGVCEICGDDISEERLIARPVTTFCIDCKTEAEFEEKRKKA